MTIDLERIGRLIAASAEWQERRTNVETDERITIIHVRQDDLIWAIAAARERDALRDALEMISEPEYGLHRDQLRDYARQALNTGDQS